MKYILLCLLTSGLYGLTLTGGEVGFTFEPELNRTFYAGVDFASFGSVTINSYFTVQGGTAFGVTGKVFDMKAFTKAEYTLPIKIPLTFSLHYIYNGLPEYKTHIQALSGMIAVKWRYAGTAIGSAWRFTAFNKEAVIVEPIFAFSAYFNVYNAKKGRVGLECANYANFVSGNMGAYSLKLYSVLRITENCSFINDVTVYQTGSVGLSAQVYGIAYRGGILFTW
ncbi:MAG: hypothetical protein LBG87_02240 [Spirochaetaceae bacterium]|jgi:hypothetical protein|nr:hypothetical protein [Spirochaetaceae bacterium]